MQSDDTTVRIPLRAKDGSVRAYALIDADDADFVNQWEWHFASNYAVRNERFGDSGWRQIFMHREILDLPRLSKYRGPVGDHINRDKLDNRRANLRAVSKSEDAQNGPPRGGTSATPGVNWHKRQRKWIARVRVGDARRHLGSFDTEEAASAAIKAMG
ncbi:MAG TPA: AP2 domain-containing protein [Candidatus Saccharimonadia bacterium]|nr:AP2 domain-containing protein [Candidatus Saccharimonadia bacterium]